MSFSQFSLLVKSPRGNHFWEFPMNLSKDILNTHTHEFVHSCLGIYIWIWRIIWDYKKWLDCQVKFNFTTIWHLIQYKAFQIVWRILVIVRHRWSVKELELPMLFPGCVLKSYFLCSGSNICRYIITQKESVFPLIMKSHSFVPWHLIKQTSFLNGNAISEFAFFWLKFTMNSFFW